MIFAALGATGIDFIHTTEYRVTAPAFEDGTQPWLPWPRSTRESS